MECCVLQSESGTFFCNDAFFAVRFQPALENVIEENRYRHFIVPEGIVGFCEEFGRGMAVTQCFHLPATLREIGNVGMAHPFERCCVLANTKLPEVVIPDLAAIGTFAFGNSEIEALCLPEGYPKHNIAYARQFKGTHVRKLYLHKDDVPSSCGVSTMLPYEADEVYTYTSKPSNGMPTESVLICRMMYNG